MLVKLDHWIISPKIVWKQKICLKPPPRYPVFSKNVTQNHNITMKEQITPLGKPITKRSNWCWRFTKTQAVNLASRKLLDSKSVTFARDFFRVHEGSISLKGSSWFPKHSASWFFCWPPKRHCPRFFCFFAKKKNIAEKKNTKKSPKECPKSTSFFTFCTSDLMSNHDASSLPKPNAERSKGLSRRL